MKPRTHNNVYDALKKYEPHHSSARQLFSSLDPKIALSELVSFNKFSKPKKIVLLPHRISFIIPPEKPFDYRNILNDSPTNITSSKTPKKYLKRDNSSKQSLFECTEIRKSPSFTRKNISNHLERLSESPIMQSCDKLIRNCSEVLQNRRLKFISERKKVKRISKNIQNITENPDENFLK